MAKTDEERSITFTPSCRRREAFDLDELGETEEQLLQRAERLRLRHEELMKTNSEYAALDAQLSDYRDDSWHSGVPITSKATVEMIKLVNTFLHYEERKRKWYKEANAKKDRRSKARAAANREARRLEREKNK